MITSSQSCLAAVLPGTDLVLPDNTLVRPDATSVLPKYCFRVCTFTVTVRDLLTTPNVFSIICISFCWSRTVYDESSAYQVKFWSKLFKCAREFIEDDPHTRRPKEPSSVEMFQQVENLTLSGRYLKLDMFKVRDKAPGVCCYWNLGHVFFYRLMIVLFLLDTTLFLPWSCHVLLPSLYTDCRC